VTTSTKVLENALIFFSFYFTIQLLLHRWRKNLFFAPGLGYLAMPLLTLNL